ncbi:MAG TPA: guanylate kinase [Terriglobales bacterium]|jgi:guanylate kinase|nr:guanylate kinase [Terriglobales bacterium]
MTIVYIISAPSGSGKSTLVNELRKTVSNLEFSVSYTTRPPRGSEQNGHEYFFISREEFKRLLAEKAFLEHAEVFGHYYGTARRFLEEAQQRRHDLLLDIDVQGERQVKQAIPDALSIFILPPTRQELERRLRRRSQAEGMMSEEVIQKRLATAAREIENYRNYDYILVNDQLEQSIDGLKAIVLAERARRTGGSRSAEEEKWLVTAGRHRQDNMCRALQPILESFALSATPGGR